MTIQYDMSAKLESDSPTTAELEASPGFAYLEELGVPGPPAQ